MKRIISFLAYVWASLATPLILALFIGLGAWQQQLLKLPFMRIDPVYSGGEVVDSLVADDYKIMIHERVFPGVFSESDDGFVQMDITSSLDFVSVDSLPLAGRLTDICLTSDSISLPDFDVINWSRTRDGWIVRVAVHR